MLPLAWGIIRALRSGEALTLSDLRGRLKANSDALTKRLDRLEAVGVVLVLPDDIEPDARQGHSLRYRLDPQRLDQLVTTWRAYLGR